ncbi:MAG: hypothetical protein HW421_186 [Ignavibacteria bacterium]|nr:hypothetical protein [Ignavibacteria bacterium]
MVNFITIMKQNNFLQYASYTCLMMGLRKLMMLSLLFYLSFFSQPSLKAQIFISAVVDYSLPMGKFKTVNDNGTGYGVTVESRKYCELWYGLTIEKYKYDTISGKPTIHYNEIVQISPHLKYVFVPASCAKFAIQPYIIGALIFSTIEGNDTESILGCGASLGGGICMPFKLFKFCWSLEINAQYSAPNFILRADGRPSLEAVNIGALISIGL